MLIRFQQKIVLKIATKETFCIYSSPFELHIIVSPKFHNILMWVSIYSIRVKFWRLLKTKWILLYQRIINQPMPMIGSILCFWSQPIKSWKVIWQHRRATPYCYILHQFVNRGKQSIRTSILRPVMEPFLKTSTAGSTWSGATCLHSAVFFLVWFVWWDYLFFKIGSINNQKNAKNFNLASFHQ